MNNNHLQQVDNCHVQQFNWEDCYKTAQNVLLPDLGSVCGSHVKKLVSGHASAIGCPQEYIFLPLLTTCAGLMGHKTKIKVNETWTEPPILWSMIGARTGTRKTAALKQILIPLLEVQREEERHWHLSRPSSQGQVMDSPPKFVAGPMSMSNLLEVLKKNNGQIISVMEDLEYFHQILELNENKQKERIHTLYDGLPLFDIKEGEITCLDTTCFNHTGFAKPEFIVNLHLNNPAWLSSRYIVSCSPAPNFSTIWNSNPVNPGTVSMKSIFQTLYTFHQTPREYSFSEDAWKELTRCHDEEWTSMISQLDHDEKRRGIIEKSLGQIVRVSGVIKALTNACDFASQSKETHCSNHQWDLTIDRETLCKAIELSKYFVDQKLALMLMTGFGFGVPVYSRTSAMATREVTHVQSPQHLHQHVRASLTSKLQSLSAANHFSQNGGTISKFNSSVNSQVSVASGQLPALHSGKSSNQNVKDEFGELIGLENTDDMEADLVQAAEFAQLDKQQFVTVHGKRIKRLLECYDDGNGVSATTASQKSITPPVKVAGTNNRHPVWASALFFQKCAELGIGAADQVKHPTNRKFYWRFKPKSPSLINDKLQQLLSYLKVDMHLYLTIAPRFGNVAAPISPSHLGPPPLDLIDSSGVVESDLSMELDSNVMEDSRSSECVVVKREPDEGIASSSCDSNHSNLN